MKKTSVMVITVLTLLVMPLTMAAFGQQPKHELRFDADGKFTIVQFTDIQDSYPIDARTVNAMAAILDKEQPDFVILTGDLSMSGVTSREMFEKYVAQFAQPMEERLIPWSHVYGNHDEDHVTATGLYKEDQQVIYEAFPYNVSDAGPADVDGIGNYVLPVLSSTGDDVVFNIWALDSGAYLQDNNAWYNGRLEDDVILGVMPYGRLIYDFVKFSQISWYWNESVAMEKAAGKKVPGLMFMHMPLPEHRLIDRNPGQTGMTGEKNEEVSNSPVNGGLFAALLQRGDVKGVFVGHDHVNTYMGTYAGIDLGFSGSIGFGTYGLSGFEQHRLRGGRVFKISETDPANYETYMAFASDVMSVEEIGIQADATTVLRRASGTLLFSDDFERENLGPGWVVYDAVTPSEPSDWGIRAGALVHLSNIFRMSDEFDHWQGSNIVAGSPFWSDYELSFTMGALDDDGMGALIRYQDEDNYYRFIMVDDPTNLGPFRRLEKYVDGVRYVLDETTDGYVPGKLYGVVIQAVGDQITVYLDGERILEAADATHTRGKVGLMAYANDSVQVDDLQVIAIP